ncbi:erythromycin esterase family protein [Nocardia sp. NBC_01499]|uniref:erythromycin esterase family protein n=1 Tax=Nocardia sp. NBC_01499 TaxID=2903597 RepID=UPI0038677AE5
MSQNIRDFVSTSCDLVGLGEPTHQEPAFQLIRNELFAQLVDLGFRSIALETDRVAALIVNDFVQEGIGDLDTVLSEGFSHTFGNLDGNRQLVTWMHEYNQHRPPQDRVAFHGLDAQTENTTAPSPRRYLEYARDYLRLDLDLATLLGADELWDREEAILNPAKSIGATPEAERLRAMANDMLISLDVRAPELIAATSRAEWLRARTHLTAGLGLLRYHKQAARDLARNARISLLMATRAAIMAQNLLDIRSIEARRGATLAHAHNDHLRRNPSTMRVAGLVLDWLGVGAIVGSLLGEQYAFIAGSLGRSDILGIPEPEPDTYEGLLQSRIGTWGLTPATTISAARTRTGAPPEKGYFPLDQTILGAADTVLHIGDATAALPKMTNHDAAPRRVTSDT